MTSRLPGRYEITNDVYEGGQGKVYICKDKHLDRLVAIKVIKDINDKKALVREIAAIREIKSKHIIQIYDLIDAEKNGLGLVEEFLSGGNVEPFHKSNPFPTQPYLKVLFQIASGVSDIHSHGRVHRDIKPTNMKFNDEGVLNTPS